MSKQATGDNTQRTRRSQVAPRTTPPFGSDLSDGDMTLTSVVGLNDRSLWPFREDVPWERFDCVRSGVDLASPWFTCEQAAG